MSANLDPFRLTLPSDVMDQVVARLPPPGPKLVPAFVIEHNGYALESIYVSKGISEEERDIICQSFYVDWDDKSVVYWFGDCRGGFDKKDFLISVKFLGFRFETQWDRVNYEQISDESGKAVRITLVKNSAN